MKMFKLIALSCAVLLAAPVSATTFEDIKTHVMQRANTAIENTQNVHNAIKGMLKQTANNTHKTATILTKDVKNIFTTAAQAFQKNKCPWKGLQNASAAGYDATKTFVTSHPYFTGSVITLATVYASYRTYKWLCKKCPRLFKKHNN